jgi:nucleotide-binding universal stress UspA family protein
MSTEQRPIVVGIDDSPGSDAALRWAIDDAGARKVPVRVVHAYHWEYARTQISEYVDTPGTDLYTSVRTAKGLIAKAIDRARELDATVEIRGDAVDGDAAQVLIGESHYANTLVLGSRHLKAFGSAVLGSVGATAAARSECPAVVVRGPAGLPDEGAGVVVGVDGTEAAETVLGFGFDHASQHRVPLRAVLCWHPDALAAMSWRADPPAPARAEAWLSEALGGWREKYPDVVVHAEVIRAHPVAGLVSASTAQYLLVVGNHGRHAVRGTLLGSVSQGVLHHATCPVAVVPTALAD